MNNIYILHVEIIVLFKLKRVNIWTFVFLLFKFSWSFYLWKFWAIHFFPAFHSHVSDSFAHWNINEKNNADEIKITTNEIMNDTRSVLEKYNSDFHLWLLLHFIYSDTGRPENSYHLIQKNKYKTNYHRRKMWWWRKETLTTNGIVFSLRKYYLSTIFIFSI